MLSSKARFTLILFDILALISAFIISAQTAILFSPNIVAGTNISELLFTHYESRMLSFGALSIVALITFHNKGHYSRRIPWWSLVRYVMITTFMMLILDGFINFAAKTLFSRMWLGFAWVYAFIFILVGRNFSMVIGKKYNFWDTPTIILGSGTNLIETLYAISTEEFTGYDIKKVLLINSNKFNNKIIPSKYRNIKVLKNQSDYKDIVKNSKNYFCIFAPNNLNEPILNDLIKSANKNTEGFAIVPPAKGISLYGLTPQFFFGYDLMFLRPENKLKSPIGFLLKNLLDYVGSFILISLFIPFLIIISPFLKKDGGPIFYSQDRIGRDNKKFKCWKLRTMVVDAEQKLQEILEKDKEAKEMWKTHRKLHNDPRITKLGKLLRKSSLDELPQLYNVLKGDMSLVGPRPILSDEVHFFTKEQIELYFSVKPGITGLWQVSGRNNTTFKQRAYLDSWYVKNWSLWYDIVIGLKTLTTILKRSGAS